jgi:prepilin-type N-terminal cleavage/methylation domain-containing protein
MTSLQSKVANLNLPRKDGSMRQQIRGFSLLEMVIVIAIGMILTGITFIALKPLLNQSHVNSAYDTTLMALAYLSEPGDHGTAAIHCGFHRAGNHHDLQLGSRVPDRARAGIGLDAHSAFGHTVHGAGWYSQHGAYSSGWIRGGRDPH